MHDRPVAAAVTVDADRKLRVVHDTVDHLDRLVFAVNGKLHERVVGFRPFQAGMVFVEAEEIFAAAFKEIIDLPRGLQRQVHAAEQVKVGITAVAQGSVQQPKLHIALRIVRPSDVCRLNEAKL